MCEPVSGTALAVYIGTTVATTAAAAYQADQQADNANKAAEIPFDIDTIKSPDFKTLPMIGVNGSYLPANTTLGGKYLFVTPAVPPL